MSQLKKVKRKQHAEKRERRERRFSPEPTSASRIATYVGMAGALVLGAGVYGEWIRDEALAYAPYLVAVGALGLGGALWKGSTEIGQVRVGDAGVALERGGDLVRILWCDIERVSLENGRLSLRGKRASIGFPLSAHPKAASWILTEGGRRVPDVIAVSRTELEKLPEAKDLDGELVPVEELQITGRACRQTGKAIAFERDARLCPRCGETYLKEEVPKKCLTCGGELGARAREV